MANGEWNAEAAAGYVHTGIVNSLEYMKTVDPKLLDETMLEIMYSQILTLRLKARETHGKVVVVRPEWAVLQ